MKRRGKRKRLRQKAEAMGLVVVPRQDGTTTETMFNVYSFTKGAKKGELVKAFDKDERIDAHEFLQKIRLQEDDSKKVFYLVKVESTVVTTRID